MKRRLRTRRSGITLLELLVVATIMLTLTAVSVPAIKPMMEARLTTSAATSVSTYLNRARARAMSTGRPCGVTFEFFDGTCLDENWNLESEIYSQGSASLVLRQVETPPYYAGLETDATATVLGYQYGYGPGNSDYGVCDAIIDGKNMRRFFVSDPAWEKYVLSEEAPKIQFDSIGPYYSIYIPRDADGDLVVDARYANSGDASDPNRYLFYIEQLPGAELPQRVASPFKVVRDPRATMTAPIGLAQGAVVDLAYSGTDDVDFALGGDVTIVFGPNGEVDYVVDAKGTWRPTDAIYLMIGRWDRIAALAAEENHPIETYYYISGAEDGLWNYEDASNRWVTINPRSGLVSTVEVMPPSNYGTASDDTYAKKERTAILDSREFARNSKRNIGAR